MQVGEIVQVKQLGEIAGQQWVCELEIAVKHCWQVVVGQMAVWVLVVVSVEMGIGVMEEDVTEVVVLFGVVVVGWMQESFAEGVKVCGVMWNECDCC